MVVAFLPLGGVIMIMTAVITRTREIAVSILGWSRVLTYFVGVFGLSPNASSKEPCVTSPKHQRRLRKAEAVFKLDKNFL